MRRELKTYSKFLSLVLRHDPSVIEIELDESGWVEVSILLAAIQRKFPDFTFDTLIEIVETNDKRRFALSDDSSKIRASQGHSIGIDLKLRPQTPPDELFHGTAILSVPSIKEKGLIRGKRDFVHLSLDHETAKRVGSRHGKPIVLLIKANEMVKAGYLFYLSENGVWLTSEVPSCFIVFPDG